MDDSQKTVPKDLILLHAKRNPAKLKLLTGGTLKHETFGTGLVDDVVVNGRDATISILFGESNTPRKLAPQALKFCDEFTLPAQAALDFLRPVDPPSPGRSGQAPRSAARPAPASLRPVPPQPSSPVAPPAAFNVGQEVFVQGQTVRRGMVSKITDFIQREWHYEIFFSADEKRIYRESDLAEISQQLLWGRLDDLLRELALAKLRRPLSDNLYALYGSRTQFEVYQFKPALKFLANPDQRLLIADEVGLGKTIEAGIIYLELQARLEVNRVLIVCPSGLRYKWQEELRLRFDEEFQILDKAAVERFFTQYSQFGEGVRLRGIVSLELLRRQDLADQLEELRVQFDLVVIDEAHHCRNTGTLSNGLANILSDNADAMLLLTATPLQMGNQDLFNLFRILSPGEFDDASAFLTRLEPNQFVNQASQVLGTGDHKKALGILRNVERTAERERFLGNPFYSEVTDLLKQDYLPRIELVRAQRRLIELNTLASIFTRTRKREIGEKVPIRAAFTLAVAFTPEERQFYNRVIDHVREEFRWRTGSSFASGWVSVMRERQTASCISAARERFSELAVIESMNSSEEESFMDHDVVGEWDERDLSRSSGNQQQFYSRFVKAHASPKVDSKFNLFWETLQKVLAEDDHSKILVFSFFIDSIEYLYDQLHRRGVGVLRMHGRFNVADRARIIDQFRQSSGYRVLISSDVGAEGLDFQFCNTIFNYDLPWNPMKVEQRIGRIDRFGQESERIRIYNMVIDESIESRILMRLYERIGIFERAIGDIEAILGDEIRELTRKVYSSRLTPDEEMRLAGLSATNIVRRTQELEEFEEKRLQFMGQEAIFSTLVNQAIDSGNFLSDLEIRSLVLSFMQREFPLTRLYEEHDATCSIDVNVDFDQYLRAYIQTKKRSDHSAQEFLKNLGSGKTLPITFSSKLAFERKLLNFLNLRHPITQAAVDYWKEKIVPGQQVAHAGLRTNSALPGAYYFFIFLLHAEGVEKNTQLVSVVVVPDEEDVHVNLSMQLLRLLQTSAVDLTSGYPEISAAELERVESAAMQHMVSRRDQIEMEIRRSNAALVNARLTAVTQSYEAKKRRVAQTLDTAHNERIIRMRQAQLRNMEAKYRSSVAQIEKQKEVLISFNLVIKGVVEVFEDQK